MTILSYPSEQAFLDYSMALSKQMPNVKLNTLRKAMAGVDHFRKIESYRTALKAAEAFSGPLDSVVYLDAADTLNIRISHELPYGISDCEGTTMVERLNGKIEVILGGESGYILQDFSTDKRDDGLYDISAYASLDDAEEDDIYRILKHLFTGDRKETFNTYRVAKHAFYKAVDYIADDDSEGVLELDESEYPINVDEFMLPFSSDDVRDAVSDETRNTFDQHVKDETRDMDLELEQISAQSGQDLMATIIEEALRKIKVRTKIVGKKQAITSDADGIIFELAHDMVLNKL
tara:strand:+ start:1360 stop:2232 length:873 start_codon:yes stop_codon:yes gene_type:complete